MRTLTDHATDNPDTTTGQKQALLYVHVPFCRSRCTFCDWVQAIPNKDLTRRAGDPIRERYVEALCHEIRTRGPEYADKEISTIYWGGGTASNLTEDETVRVMTAITETFDLNPLTESTIECSPDTVDEDKLVMYRELGFNRVSSGVQSFDPDRLRSLGRRHSAEEARGLPDMARRAGFEHVSIDLMSGFADQTNDELMESVETALTLPLDHLSLYSYRPTEGTHLRKKMDPKDKRDYIAQQYALYAEARMRINEVLPEYGHGYFGRKSAFTTLYFQAKADTLGFGSGAASFSHQRLQLHRSGALHAYITNPLSFELDEPLDNDRTLISFIQAGLSTNEGITRTDWSILTGTELLEVLDRTRIRPLADLLRHRGLIEDEQGIRLEPEVRNLTLIQLAFEMAVFES